MHTDKVSEENALWPERDVTEKILGSTFKVQNTLGCGFLEKVYENTLVVELKRLGIPIEQQDLLQVRYDGVIVGDYLADLVVDNRVIVECKAVNRLDPVHEAQLMNYSKATGIRVGLLLNFGRPNLQYRRFVV